MMSKQSTLLIAVAFLAACGKDKAPAADSTAMPQEPVAAAPAAPAVTDPQIAAIVVAANTADIEAGKLAVSKSSNAKVKEFGKLMSTDHGGVNKAAVALVTKLKVTPEENDASRQQTEAGKQNRESLAGKSGADFDRAYIANEVTYHEGLLAAIDQTLLPSVQNGELKALLEQTRPVVVAHLKQAQDIQAAMK